MTKKPTASVAARQVLFAMLSALSESKKKDLLTETEFYALHSAFITAKPYMNGKSIREFARDMILFIDTDKLRSGDAQYSDTFEAFLQVLLP